MNLPFSPTFFRKMDIFQQLMEYEEQKVNKHLWDGEKAVLIWAASEHHQHLGSAIDSDHVKDAIKYCVEKGLLSEESGVQLQNSVHHILKNMALHEYGKPESDPVQRNDLKINKDGILAGQILIDTSNLKNTKKYERWSWDWWLLYYAAGLVIVFQVIKLFLELVNMFL